MDSNLPAAIIAHVHSPWFDIKRPLSMLNKLQIFVGFQCICRVKEHVRRHGIKQAVAVLSLGGPRAASLNDAVEDLVKVYSLSQY